MDSTGLNYPFIAPFFIKTWLLSAVFSGMGHALSSHCHHFNRDSHAALDVIGHRRQHEAGLVALDPQVTRLGDAIMLFEDAKHALDHWRFWCFCRSLNGWLRLALCRMRLPVLRLARSWSCSLPGV